MHSTRMDTWGQLPAVTLPLPTPSRDTLANLRAVGSDATGTFRALDEATMRVYGDGVRAGGARAARVGAGARATLGASVDLASRALAGAGRALVAADAAVGVALLASALSIAAYVYYSSRGLTLTYNDAISHMMIARRVVAGRTPGLAQLGTTWLPFNHILMLPFVWIDPLFRSGLAGALPSMAAFVVSGLYLYRLGIIAFSSARVGWLAALIFTLNPNVLYMQSTAMSELDLLCFAILAIFYTVRWAHNPAPRELVKAAAATLAGTLVRYDGWALALALAGAVAAIAWRRRGRTHAESNLVLFGVLAFSGCVGWLIYNLIIFGDALSFFSGAYSSKAMQKRLAEGGGLPTLHNLTLSLHVYAQATIDNNWMPLVLIACVGVLIWTLHERFALENLALYALLVPFAFNWLSLVMGNSALRTPEIPVQGQATYYNVRYGLMMIPAVAVFVAYLARRSRLLVGAILALTLLFGAANTFIHLPYSLQDPINGVAHSAWSRDAGRWMRSNYHGGDILLSYASLASTIYFADQPDNEFITDSNGNQFTSALAHPNQYVEWILLDQENPADLVSATLGPRQDWRQYYVLRQTFGPVQIYQSIDTLSGPPTGTPTPPITRASSPMLVATPSPMAQPAAPPTPQPAPTATPIPTPTPRPMPSPITMPSPTPTP